MDKMLTPVKVSSQTGHGVDIEETTPTGIVTASVGNSYPNPARTSISFPITLDGAGNVNIMVFDITGHCCSLSFFPVICTMGCIG
ncbi:MAG: hypothetical protein KAR40_10315 [Candidatus Sabulitectum sp.]|nr:hypothetical protein [Candidatus Sabulitectum sp.]